MTSSTIREQNAFLKKYSLDDAVEMVKQSIRNNWAGIFQIKKNENEKLKKGTSEARMEALKKF